MEAMPARMSNLVLQNMVFLIVTQNWRHNAPTVDRRNSPLVPCILSFFSGFLQHAVPPLKGWPLGPRLSGYFVSQGWAYSRIGL